MTETQGDAALDQPAPPPPEPESRGRVLARNMAALMASQMTTWILSLVGLAVIPRFLGAESIGLFHLANSIWYIGLVIAVFGMDMVLIKAVARNPDRIGPLLGAALAARTGLFVVASAIITVYSWLAGYSGELVVILLIVATGTLAATMLDGFNAALQGIDRMGPMSVANIAGRLIFVLGAVAFLIAGYGVYAVAAMAALGEVVTLVYVVISLRRIRRELGDHESLRTDWAAVKALLAESLPYFGIGLLMALYQQSDAILISLLVEDNEVLGWYSVYDRLAGTMLFVPTVFMAAVYPTLSRMYSEGDGTSDEGGLAHKMLEVMVLISVPVGLGMAGIAKPFVSLVFGSDFENAAPVVAVGGVVITLTYLTSTLGVFLVSMDRQREWSRFVALGVLMTGPLDLFLVPYFQNRYDNGAIGGASAYLVTESLILAGAIYLLPRGWFGRRTVGFALRAVLAGLIMLGVVLVLRDQFLAIPVVAGGVTYAVMVWVLRLVGSSDIELVRLSLPGRS